MGATAGVMMVLGKVYQGQQQKASLQGAANQLSMEAGQSNAAGIQRTIMERRKTDIVASNANAEIAASGLSTTGTSAQAVVGGIKGQGEYNARTALYEGEQRGNELNYDATLRRNESKAAVTASYFSAAGSAVSDGTDFYSKYGSAA